MDQHWHEGSEPPTRGGAPKPPPWQVPKPELRHGLQNLPGQPACAGDAAVDGAPGAIFDPFERGRERELAGAAVRKKRSQRRTVVVGLGVAPLLAGTITAMVASNNEEPDYARCA
jgi:hypothetical protein